MQHPVMKLDHRIPWNVLKRALNQVLAGTVSADLVNALLKLSPSDTSTIWQQFKHALSTANAIARDRANGTSRTRALHADQVTALEAVEREIFSLPCNLALGLNNRADDPGGENMDFTPADVDWQGNRTVGLAGQRQRLMEKLMGSLCATTIDVAVISTTCTELCTLIGRDRLKFATAAEISHWHPGPPAQGEPWLHIASCTLGVPNRECSSDDSSQTKHDRQVDANAAADRQPNRGQPFQSQDQEKVQVVRNQALGPKDCRCPSQLSD